MFKNPTRGNGVSEERKRRILTLMNTDEGRRRIDEILEAAAATTDLFVQASQPDLTPLLTPVDF